MPTAGVPEKYPVALNGRPYMVDTKEFRQASIPLQRPQADTQPLPGEHTFNPEDLWPRQVATWHRGAGQDVYDRVDSDPARFRESLGVDVFEQWELSLLGDVENKLVSTEDNVRVIAVGSRLYCADGQLLKYTTDILTAGVATWTTVTGTPAADITGLATDGFNVWVAFGSSGIYKTDRSSGAAASYSTLDATNIAFAKGRLMATHDGSIYNIVAASDAITHVASSSTTYDANGKKSLSVPTGTTEGDVLIVAISLGDATTTVDLPDAWTRLDEGHSGANGVVVFYKLASQSEGTINVTIADIGVGKGVIACSGYRSAIDDVDLVVNSHGVQASASSVSVVAPSITTTVGNTMMVFVGSTNTGTTFTPPTGYTERVDADGSVTTLTIADDIQAAAGASGTVTATAAAAAVNTGALLAIRPNIPEALFTHSNTDFEFVGLGEGKNHIYAAGFSGDKTEVYKTEIKPDGTALDTPTIAGRLPDGEIARSIYGYLGFVFAGTDGGLRMAKSDDDGNLDIGALIETDSAVRCFEGQKNYVWYGLEDFDVSRWASGTYDGLGRLDLTQEILPVTPAHVSDLMVTGSTGSTEQVLSVATFQDVRVFSIADTGGASRGVYAERAVKVASGWIDSGLITYGSAAVKVATYVDVRHNPLTGTVQVYTAPDQGTFVSRGTSSTANSTAPASPFSAGPTRGEVHELRLTLSRSGTSDEVGPVVTSVTLRSEPAPKRGRFFQVPLLLYEWVATGVGIVDPLPQACADELATLFDLFDTQTLITYEDRSVSTQVFVRDIEFGPQQSTEDREFWQGIALVTLKEPAA